MRFYCFVVFRGVVCCFVFDGVYEWGFVVNVLNEFEVFVIIIFGKG